MDIEGSGLITLVSFDHIDTFSQYASRHFSPPEQWTGSEPFTQISIGMLQSPLCVMNATEPPGLIRNALTTGRSVGCYCLCCFHPEREETLLSIARGDLQQEAQKKTCLYSISVIQFLVLSRSYSTPFLLTYQTFLGGRGGGAL